MKKFNLKKAQQGAEVCTKDGHAAKILLFDRDNSTFPLVVIIDNKTVYFYTNEGVFYSNKESDLDLRMK